MSLERPTEADTRSGRLFVTDFDGTMTRHDFYQLVREDLLPPDLPDYWAEYRAGRMTHFEALRAYFASIRADEAEVLAVVDRMGLDSNLPDSLRRLREAGWEVVVASAGCDWYIRILLARAGVELPVWSNPGRFEAGRGLIMTLPDRGPYYSPTLGVDKAAVVREGQAHGLTVAFAGDGFPDLDAAHLVPAELRFARGDLADALDREKRTYRRFDRWSEIAGLLCDRGGAGIPRDAIGRPGGEVRP